MKNKEKQCNVVLQRFFQLAKIEKQKIVVIAFAGTFCTLFNRAPFFSCFISFNATRERRIPFSFQD